MAVAAAGHRRITWSDVRGGKTGRARTRARRGRPAPGTGRARLPGR
ncbi:hypothetical protein TOK_5776 [Pseudonocardia sp. N23]|nr:hypothetical protein TOK_5776 [Pseudonocardia sp. N23]